MKTWDVLDRETGRLVRRLPLVLNDGWTPVTLADEVAYCRETGEVVYR